MDIINALSEGKRGAVARSTEIAEHILRCPEELPLLVEALSFHDEAVVSHAAHACLTIFQQEAELLVPYKKHFLAILLQYDQWELVEQLSKIVPHLGCTVEEGTILSTKLLAVVENGHSSIARTCALQALVDLAALDAIYEGASHQALSFALEKGTKAMLARARMLVSEL